MHPDVLWLARLGLDQGLFTRADFLRVRKALGEGAELMDYAQKLIDDGLVTDIEKLEKLAGLALAKGRLGPPVDDSSEEDAPSPPASPASRVGSPGIAGKAGGAHGAAAEHSEAGGHDGPAARKADGPVPTFPFAAIEAMDDASLAAGLKRLLRDTALHGASDLHLCSGARPYIRKARALAFIDSRPLSAEEALRLNTILLDPEQRSAFAKRRDLDYALSVAATERYRVNLMVHKQGASGAYRMVPSQLRSLSDLGFSAHLATLKKMLSYHNGLVLVTGPVGSGKTTTLAAMVAYLNETREDHIITVEDPIEVVQPARGCNVTQREVGKHTRTFFTALKGALREDPDVIVIGELRDLETIEMAVSAAETGHLVIGTMHTSDAANTLNRLLDVFPPAQQTQIRTSVAESLRGIVCQRLLPGIEGGLVPACEILVNVTAISNLIREGKTTGLRNTMETGVREGMCLMDNVVYGLWQERQISAATALANVANRVLRAKIS